MNKLPTNVDLGLLLVRLMLGVIGFYHGAQKLFGLFGGHGIQGTAKFFGENLNIPMPTVSAVAAGAAEFCGGILIALGLFSRPAALAMAFTMGVAIVTAHLKNGFGAQGGGFEYPLLILVASLAIVIGGPGRYAITPKL